MHHMVQTIRRIAQHEMGQRCNASLALVKSVYGRNGTADYSCTVELRESGIVLPKVPIATSLIGLAALPREDDLVLVLFVGGDIHAPVVVGRLYNETVSPPKHGPGEFVTSLPGGEESPDKSLELRIKTPGDGSRELHVLLDGDVKVELVIDNEGIRLQAQDTKLSLKQTGSSDGKAELTVGNSSVVIEQAGNITVKAEGKLLLKAQEVEISGDTSVKVAGQTIDLN
jgi:uncharacterized protein involved in type VI secretion and phage assembly